MSAAERIAELRAEYNSLAAQGNVRADAVWAELEDYIGRVREDEKKEQAVKKPAPEKSSKVARSTRAG